MKVISQNLGLKSSLSWTTNHDYSTFMPPLWCTFPPYNCCHFIFHISLLYKTPSLHTSLTVNRTPRYVCPDLLVGPRAVFEGHRIIVVLLQDTSCITTKQDGKVIVAIVGGNVFRLWITLKSSEKIFRSDRNGFSVHLHSAYIPIQINQSIDCICISLFIVLFSNFCFPPLNNGKISDAFMNSFSDLLAWNFPIFTFWDLRIK